jgi:UDP-glucose 4-epimerase
MKRVLITGVAGFIGSNLAKELLSKGYQVTGIDNFSQGAKRNIKDIMKSPSFGFIKTDVCDSGILSKLNNKLDYIVHLAAYKIPRYGDAISTLKVNIKGTENVLEIARKNKCRVLFASTSDVYGKNPILPFNEKSDLVLGSTDVDRWSYSVSKIYDEHLCFAYHRAYGIPVTIVRYFGGYGPGQHLSWWGGPQSVFINCALKNRPMPIHGNGKQTRSFTYISDIVKGTIAAMEREEAIGEVFNIGNTREVTILELAKMIWKMVNPKSKPSIKFVPYRKFSHNYEDVLRRVPDSTKARQILNFSANVELEEGLPITIKWQRQFVK